MKYFIKVLEKSYKDKFSGLLNILCFDSRRLLGIITFSKGFITYASYDKNELENAIYSFIVDLSENKIKVDFIKEPHLFIKKGPLWIDFKFILEKSKVFYKNLIDSKILLPPKNINLLVNNSIFNNNKNISESELDTLIDITDFSKVSELYKKTNDLNRLTIDLVSLRKKKILSVVKENIS